MPEVVVEDDVDDMNIIVVVVVVPVEDDVVAAVSAPVMKRGRSRWASSLQFRRWTQRSLSPGTECRSQSMLRFD